MASTDSPKSGDQDVFSSLPSHRATRRSAKRPSRAATAEATATTKAKPKRAKATAQAKPKPRAATAAKPKAKAKPRAAAKPRPRPEPAPPARSTVPPAGYATPRPDEVPSGREGLLSTAVQAAGEITQIGLAAGTRAISSALRRLPRP